MKKKQLLSLFLAFAILIGMTGCMVTDEKQPSESSKSTGSSSSTDASGAQTTEDDGFTPYAEEITVRVGRDLDPNSTEEVALADLGEPYTDNRWIKLMKEKLNIKVEYELAASGDQYTQQIKLGLTSGELPDYPQVLNFSDFQQMASAGVLTDMTELYEKYASPLLRSIIEKEGEDAYLPVTYDGKMYGIPGKMPSTNGYNFLWIRQDWLDNLKLERPKTMDDVMEVARAFKTLDPDGNGQDDTLGMRFDKDFMWSKKGIFWGFGAYPQFWLEKDGKTEQGTVQPEMKEALGFIKTMYDEGLIDKEFATKDFNKSQEDVVSGKVGMFYGFHWEASAVKQSMEKDDKANWVVIPLPTKDGSEAKIPLTNAVESAMTATTNAEHPEAVIKMMNVYVEALFGETGDFNKYFSVEGAGAIWNKGPVVALDPELDLQGYRDWKKADEDNSLETLGGSGKGFYDCAQAGLKEYELMFGPGESAFAYVDATYPGQVIWNAYFGAPMPTEVERGSSMDEYINTTLFSLITGQMDLDSGFDEMVSSWNSMGGELVTKEVNDRLAEE